MPVAKADCFSPVSFPEVFNSNSSLMSNEPSECVEPNCSDRGSIANMHGKIQINEAELEPDVDFISGDDLSKVNVENIYCDLRKVRLNNSRNIILSHININSLRNKFSELVIILKEKLVDILIVSEVKLDETYTNELFKVDDYCVYRQDNTARSGGIIVYV